ncbi:conserved hypothetical protein [Cryptococcus deneoformans JEC21]|uniref:Uncharacterized protein n=1 Tax=Cryptococcus deneoformans (strain JEC21 / ATCC MYA-565) TaxID=214684 RepID=Q5KA13_CRYD1|nr:conserved hypothetical protein [Cryptococcus neoformans var. neoformans JEC21]AAW45905.2 conserved hypothetical protein [Cryptococcus neoformans var. neoformans JEC21]
METVWTRFQPTAYVVEEVIKSGILGKPKRFFADFSMGWDIGVSADTSQMVNPALGGGSLLDMSAYPSVWTMLLVHGHPLNADKPQGGLHPSNYLPSFWSRYQFEVIGGVEGALPGNVDADLDNAGQKNLAAVLQCEEGDLVVAYPAFQFETF